MAQTRSGAQTSFGALVIARGNPADAVHHHTEALTNVTETGRRLEQARAMDGLAKCAGRHRHATPAPGARAFAALR